MRRRGPGATLRLLAGELWFDAWFRTETRAVLEGSELGTLVGAADDRHAIYHAVNPIVFARAIVQLQALAPDALSQGSFIDFGSGKGRALILAARAGFQRVVGVEWSPVLHALCRRNLESAWERRALRSAHELHLCDAARFTVPDDSSVWFWFNPFDATLTDRVAMHLLDSLKRRPRPAYLIYARPTQVAVLVAQGFRIVSEVRLAPDYLDALILKHRLAGS